MNIAHKINLGKRMKGTIKTHTSAALKISLRTSRNNQVIGWQSIYPSFADFYVVN